ncbi:class I SAM-dependent methyltransferase [Chloroflexota bacterium]
MAADVYSVLNLVHLKELIIGTEARERMWATRHLHKGSDWNDTQHLVQDDEWVMGYWDSRNHSHRQFLITEMSASSGLSSILEIGCNCGPNLYLLAKKYPAANLEGIDINPRAVQKGNELFASEGIENVKLSVGQADELGQFPDKSFDIVITDAVLMYIGRDKIKQVVQVMVRIANKTLVLIERHCFEPQGRDKEGLGIRYRGSWKRDYVALLKQFVGEEHIRVTKITEDMWRDANWQEAGAIISITM